MIRDPKIKRLVKTLSWVLMLGSWCALIVLAAWRWRRGEDAYADLIRAVGMGGMVVLFGVVLPQIEARRAKRPKPTVYSSTIQD